MPDGDAQQLDVVQHPTLGELKFPKDMPFEERNASIDRLLAAPQRQPGAYQTRKSGPILNASPQPGAQAQPLGSAFERGAAGVWQGVKNVASGITSIPEMLAYPERTLEDIKTQAESIRAQGAEEIRRGDPRGVVHTAESMVPFVGPWLKQKEEQGVREGLAGPGAEVLTTSVLGELASKAPGAAVDAATALKPVRQALAEKIVSPMTYENLGETKADIRTNINPERGVVSEGMVGRKKGLAEQKIPARITELKTAANNILQNHPNAAMVLDAEPHIDAAIDNAIAEAEKVAGDTTRLENLRTALKTKYGPIRGSGQQINDLKTKIQSAARGVGAYKNTQPVEASVAAAMGDAARRIRGNVDQLFPEAAELNGRMSDLIDAQAGIRSKIASERGQSIFGNFGRSIPSTVLNRTVGSAPVRTAMARAVNIGNVKDIPEPMAAGVPVPTQARNLGAPATPPSAAGAVSVVGRQNPALAHLVTQPSTPGVRALLPQQAESLGLRGEVLRETPFAPLAEIPGRTYGRPGVIPMGASSIGSEPTAPPLIAPDTRAVRKGLLIPERTGAIEIGPTQESIYPEGLRPAASGVQTQPLRYTYRTGSPEEVIGREGPQTSGGAEVREQVPTPQATAQAIGRFAGKPQSPERLIGNARTIRIGRKEKR